MKVILTLFCCLAVLFAGSCVLMLLNTSSGLLVLGLLAVAALNIIVLIGLWGSANRIYLIALILLALADLGLAVFLFSISGDRYVGGLAVLVGLGVLAKGVLSAYFAWQRMSSN